MALRKSYALFTASRGNVSVNTLNAVAFDMPFGGYKGSGVGRGQLQIRAFNVHLTEILHAAELGKDALESYLEIKSVFVSLA